MPDPTGSGPVVRLPERVDRRARLGPFPSAGDAAKFLCYAASGALLAPWVSPFLWLPLVGVGFAVSVWRPDGRAADERALRYLLWKLRSIPGRIPVTSRDYPTIRQGFVHLAPGTYAVVVRSAGCPIAYLPPTDLEAKFAQFREVLRTAPGQFAFLSTTIPIRARPWLPRSEEPMRSDRDARQGYAELTELLCRRRRVRRVYVAIRNSETGPDALARLNVEVGSLIERLRGLGLDPVRLANRGLQEAAYRFDWGFEEARP